MTNEESAPGGVNFVAAAAMLADASAKERVTLLGGAPMQAGSRMHALFMFSVVS